MGRLVGLAPSTHQTQLHEGFLGSDHRPVFGKLEWPSMLMQTRTTPQTRTLKGWKIAGEAKTDLDVGNSGA